MKLKILILCHEHPPLGGGGGSAASQTARQLALAGGEVVFVTSGFSGLPKKQELNGYTLHRLDIGRRHMHGCSVLELIKLCFKGEKFVRGMLETYRPDVILAYFTIPSGLIAWRLKEDYGIPYVLSLRGGDVPGFLSRELWLYQALTKPLTKRIWNNAARLCANSRYLANLAGKTTDRIVRVVANGNYTEDFRPDNSKRPTERVNLLFSGRLVPQKRLFDLLKALSLIAAEPWHLDIVGDGPLMRRLKTSAGELGMAGRVEFHGWLSKDRLPDIFQRSHVFVLPSVEEGMPNVLNEALASGMAIVASNVGGIPELVEDGSNGLLVAPGDTRALSEALKQMISRPEKVRQMGENSLSLSRRATWESAAKEMADLLEEAAYVSAQPSERKFIENKG